jgi:PAS domain S-box-containing protein
MNSEDLRESPTRSGHLEQIDDWNDAVGTIDLRDLYVPAEDGPAAIDARAGRSTSLGRLLETLPIPALLINQAGGVLFANRAWGRISQEYDDILGANIASLFPVGATADQVLTRVERVAQTGKSEVVEAAMEVGNNRIWGRLHLRAMRIEGQTGVFVLVEDLTLEKKQILLTRRHHEELERRVQERTAELLAANLQLTLEIAERKRAEEALVESEARYRSLFENAGDIVFTQDFRGTFTSINAVVERILGYRPEEILEINYKEIIHPDYLGAAAKSFVRVIRGADTGKPYEVLAKCKDGTPVWLEVTSRVVEHHGRRIEVENIARDVSDRKRAQETIQGQHQFLNHVLESLTQPFCVLDVNDYSCVIANSAARTGSASDAGSCFRLIHGFDAPCDKKGLPCPLEKVRSSGRPVTVDHLSIEKDEGPRDFEVHAYPIFNSDGDVVQAIEYFVDITDRRRLQKQLLQGQKLEAIGTLAGGIAHDFNNLLFVIIGCTRLALADAAPASEIFENLEQVDAAAMRAKDLVAQILAFSRQADQEMKPVLMGPLVKETLKFMRSSIPKTIEIRDRVASSLPPVLADPTRLHQVVMNLCTNAAHSMRENGGVLEVGLARVEMDPVAAAKHPDLFPGVFLKLTVSDTGYGMDRELIDRIFEPFFTTKKQEGGSGLGLAAVHGIVKDHGGIITVQSERGRGSTFEIFLPVTDQSADESVEADDPHPKGHERILVVDDEWSVAQMVRQMLERLGYGVVVAGGGPEAMDAFEQDADAFDMVITDMTMPEMTGAELARRLLAVSPGIPIVLCTGYSELIDEQKARDLGVRAFLMKPCPMGLLARTVRETLDGKTD